MNLTSVVFKTETWNMTDQSAESHNKIALETEPRDPARKVILSGVVHGVLQNESGNSIWKGTSLGSFTDTGIDTDTDTDTDTESEDFLWLCRQSPVYFAHRTVHTASQRLSAVKLISYCCRKMSDTLNGFSCGCFGT